MCFYSIKTYAKCGHESQSKAEHYVFELCTNQKERVKENLQRLCPEELTVRNTILLHKRTHGWCPRCQKKQETRKPLERTPLPKKFYGTVIPAGGVKINGVEGPEVMTVPGGGSSIVYGPDGTALPEDLPATEEGLIYCDLKMDDCIVAKGMIGSIGNYSRLDILSLTVSTETMELLPLPTRIENKILDVCTCII